MAEKYRLHVQQCKKVVAEGQIPIVIRTDKRWQMPWYAVGGSFDDSLMFSRYISISYNIRENGAEQVDSYSHKKGGYNNLWWSKSTQIQLKNKINIAYETLT